MDNRLLAKIMIAGAVAIFALSFIVQQANAAVRWEVNGQRGEHCYNAAGAWAIFNAARDLGESGGQLQVRVWFPEADDPFVVRCNQDRDARRSERAETSS